ncbi:MAG: hypothetical protein ACP5OA_04835 [Candidatus Woesearchaeota archaeon]|jgi:hypothetical protein|nr:hypothetical protein [Patescibacteria group bacterium]HOI19235.1 hypothetical protein [Candidatus Woesearchaeota archaeon]
MRKLKHFFRNPLIKGFLSALAIAVFGYILLILTFLFDALYQNTIRRIIGLFMPFNPDSQLFWLPPLLHISFLVIIMAISYFFFRLKLKDIYKSTFMTVPLMTLFITIGLFLYQTPWIAGIIITMLTLGIIYYLYNKKQSWLYYYTLALTCVLMLIIAIFQIEI